MFSRRKATTGLSLDYFSRLSILEGVAGIIPGTWTSRTTGLNKKLQKAQEDLPLTDPSWFAATDSRLYAGILKGVRKLSSRSPYGSRGDQSGYSDDVLTEFLSSKILYKIGASKRREISNGDMPLDKSVMNYTYGALLNFVKNFHRDLERQEQRGKGSKGIQEFGGETHDFEDPITEAISDPTSPVGRILYDWLQKAVSKVKYNSKAGWNGEEVFRIYMENLRQGGKRNAFLVQIPMNDEITTVPKPTVQFIVNHYISALTDMAASDKGYLAEALSDLKMEKEYRDTTRNVYDPFEMTNNKLASHVAPMAKALLPYFGGRDRVYDVFNGAFMSTLNGFMVHSMPTTETRYGKVNMFQITSEGLYRLKLTLYHSGKLVKELNVVTPETLPTAISNAFKITYRVNVDNLPPLPIRRTATSIKSSVKKK